VFLTRNLFVVSTWITIVAARAVAVGTRDRRGRPLAGAVLALLVASNLYGTNRIRTDPVKPDSRSAYGIVAARTRPGDVIVVGTRPDALVVAYHERTEPAPRAGGSLPIVLSRPSSTPRRLPVDGAGRLWALGDARLRPQFTGYHLVPGASRSFFQFDLSLYERDR
jgi:hypothetical protein